MLQIQGPSYLLRHEGLSKRKGPSCLGKHDGPFLHLKKSKKWKQ